MGEYHIWLWQKLAEQSVSNLKKHGFDAHFVSDTEICRSLILELVSGYETFGFGGSETTRKLGIINELEKRGKIIYDHWRVFEPGKEEDLNLRLHQGRCDCFFCSANAISATGEIVNVTGLEIVPTP